MIGSKAEFRFVEQGLYKILWLKKLLNELQVRVKSLVKLYYDNKVAINISFISIQCDRTKDVKVDRHFIKRKLKIRLFK